MENFIGFDNIINGFNKRAENDKLSHAHLIIGAEGIGKSLIARRFALKILNKEKDYNYVDIINYRPKKASFGVDEARAIIDEVTKKPYEGNRKVIIIHKGSTLTIQAQNALLKTIEEPPLGVYIIILSESLELMLETIKSRCQIYKLTPLSREDMVKFIDNLGNFDENEKMVALSYAEGIPGRAERALKDEELLELRHIIEKALKDLKNSNYMVEYEAKLSIYKEKKEEVLSVFTSYARDIIVYKELKDKKKIINIDRIESIRTLAEELSYRKLNSILECIKEARVNFLNNINYSMVISVMLIGFLEG